MSRKSIPGTIGLLAGAAFAMALGALSGCVAERLPLGGQCERNSECQSPLVCRLAHCRRECASTRDCPVGALCARDEFGIGVCLLPDEAVCGRDSDCPAPLECIGGACSEECAEHEDCAPGAVCLGEVGARGCVNPSGATCVTTANCGPGLVCMPDGRCRPPCRAPRDCVLGESCVEGFCVPLDAGMDATMDSAATDAGADSALDGATDGALDSGDTATDSAMDAVIDAAPDSGDAAADAAADAAPDSGVSCTMASDCTAPNVAVADCVGGFCVATTCAVGFGDCDADFASGCELDVRTDPDNCGLCGGECGLGGACAASLCDVVTDFEAGTDHYCFTRSSGVVYCAAADAFSLPFIHGNDYGQLGRSTVGGSFELLAFEPVMMLSDAVDVGLGAATTCAVRATGAAVCFGHNGNGESGAGTASGNHSLPVDVVGLTDATTIVMGGLIPTSFPNPGFACALSATGPVSCWGSELFRGDGGTGATNVPVAVTSVTDAVDLAAGFRHVCAVRAGGTVVCWGMAGSWLGPLGTGDTNTPIVVTGITDAERIDAATTHNCVVRTGGTVSCWGSNSSGQLGVDPSVTTMSATPVTVAGITDAVEVEVSASHSCVLRTGGTVSCWGSNATGSLGNGMMGTDSFTPVDVTGLIARSLTVRRGRSCAVRTNGALACWGGTGSIYGALSVSTTWATPTDHPFFPPTPTP